MLLLEATALASDGAVCGTVRGQGGSGAGGLFTAGQRLGVVYSQRSAGSGASFLAEESVVCDSLRRSSLLY
ncbi:hypothetical protein ES703_103836 [subsurface metagenome]